MSPDRGNFLYGKLNTEVKKNIYTGGKTNTATVHVDNAQNKIYVDAKIDVTKVETELEKVHAEYVEALEKVNNLSTQLLKVEAELKEANRELADKLEQTKVDLIQEINQVKVEIQNIIQPKLNELTNKINALKEELETKVDSLGLMNIDGVLCAVFEGEEDE